MWDGQKGDIVASDGTDATMSPVVGRQYQSSVVGRQCQSPVVSILKLGF